MALNGVAITLAQAKQCDPGQGAGASVPRAPSPTLWLQVERTEVLRSCSSPVFSRVLALEYFFEEKQPLQFHVFDAEDGATSPRNDNFLGSTECTLGQVCIPTHPFPPTSTSASGVSPANPTQVWGPSPLVTGCAALNELLNLSESYSSIRKMGRGALKAAVGIESNPKEPSFLGTCDSNTASSPSTSIPRLYHKPRSPSHYC